MKVRKSCCPLATRSCCSARVVSLIVYLFTLSKQSPPAELLPRFASQQHSIVFFSTFEIEFSARLKALDFMGSTASRVKRFFSSEVDSEASTRANTKSNAKPTPAAPLRRTQSIDSPRAAPSAGDAAAAAGLAGAKKQKVKRQVCEGAARACASS